MGRRETHTNETTKIFAIDVCLVSEVTKSLFRMDLESLSLVTSKSYTRGSLHVRIYTSSVLYNKLFSIEYTYTINQKKKKGTIIILTVEHSNAICMRLFVFSYSEDKEM